MSLREDFMHEANEVADAELVQEYVQEAEHQDGDHYWADNFSSVDDVMKDFRIYVAETQ